MKKTVMLTIISHTSDSAELRLYLSRLDAAEDTDSSPSSSKRWLGAGPLVWLGSEDGTLHVVNADPSLPLFSGGHITFDLTYPIVSSCYIENKVFLSLSNKQLLVYHRSAGKSDY